MYNVCASVLDIGQRPMTAITANTNQKPCVQSTHVINLISKIVSLVNLCIQVSKLKVTQFQQFVCTCNEIWSFKLVPLCKNLCSFGNNPVNCSWLTPKLNQTVDPTEVFTHYREKSISMETRKEILLFFTLFKLKLVVWNFLLSLGSQTGKNYCSHLYLARDSR